MNNYPNASSLLNSLLEQLATALTQLIAQFSTALSGFLNAIIP